MIKSNTKLNISLTLLLVALVIFVCENSLAQQTMETKYPGLFNGVLKLAVPAPLQADEVLVSEKVKITRSQLDSEINSSSKQIQSQLKENEFWVLENLATKKFITAEALEWSASKKIDTKNLKENDLILKYLEALTSDISVSPEEVMKLYKENISAFGGAKFKDVESFLKNELINERKQAFIEKYISEVGKRTVIKINDDWAKAQYPKATNNIVNKLRRSGKPSLIDFGASGCRPCDMMSPILRELKNEYSGTVNIEFVDVREHQILSARYGISSIPVQIFFDKNGKEIYRHTGFLSKDSIIAKFKEMGIIR